MNKPIERPIESIQSDEFKYFLKVISKIDIDESKIQKIKEKFSSFFTNEVDHELVNKKIKLLTTVISDLDDLQKKILRKKKKITLDSTVKSTFEAVFYNILQVANKNFYHHEPSEFLTIISYIAINALKTNLSDEERAINDFEITLIEKIVANKEENEDETIYESKNPKTSLKIKKFIVNNNKIIELVTELIKDLSKTNNDKLNIRVIYYISELEKIINLASSIIKSEDKIKLFINFSLQILNKKLLDELKISKKISLQLITYIFTEIQKSITHLDFNKITLSEEEITNNQALIYLLHNDEKFLETTLKTDETNEISNQTTDLVEKSSTEEFTTKLTSESNEASPQEQTIETELDHLLKKVNNFLKELYSEIQNIEKEITLKKSYLETLEINIIPEEILDQIKDEIIEESSELKLENNLEKLSTIEESDLFFKNHINKIKEDIEKLKASMIQNIQNDNFDELGENLEKTKVFSKNLEKTKKLFEKIQRYLFMIQESKNQEKINIENETLRETISEKEIHLKALKKKLSIILEKINSILQ